MVKIYYTFGTDPRYPYLGGWVTVEAESLVKAHRIFRACFPDRTPGFLNCADYYTEDEFMRSGMYQEGNHGAFCYQKLRLVES